MIRSGAGAVYAAIGLFILWARPHRRHNVALAIGLIAQGLVTITYFLIGGGASAFDYTLVTPALIGTGLGLAIAAAALLYYAWWLAQPLAPSARILPHVFAWVGVGLAGFWGAIT